MSGQSTYVCKSCGYRLLTDWPEIMMNNPDCARCLVRRAFSLTRPAQEPATQQQMRGTSQLYSSPITSWQWEFPAYGCLVQLSPNPLSDTLRLEFNTAYMNPFVDMSRESTISLAAYLVDYLERTPEKP